MVWNVILLIVGVLLLIKGADDFVEGSSTLAKKARIPALVIGLTLVSVGTSLPELSVSLTAALKGQNDMSFGNVIGSNIFNTFVVIGTAAIFTPMLIDKNMKKFDLPILMGIYGLLALFAYVITPEVIQIWEGLILFSLMFIYTGFLILRSKKEIKEDSGYDLDELKEIKTSSNIFLILCGAAGIIGGGTLVVENAEIIALALGMSELLVGLTVVSIGTSLPELVTSIVAAKKGENDIAVGNAIGSSLFNVVLILGLSCTVRPMNIELSTIVDIAVMFASALLIFFMAFGKAEVNRWKGILFILIYIAYFVYIILRNYGIV